jgi:O-antigen ligase
MRKIVEWLTLFLVFAIPWENAITLGEWGTLARIIGMLAAAIWGASALKLGELRKPHLFHMMAFFFIFWNMASFFWSFGADETEQHIKTYIQLGILTWILWDLYRTAAALRSAMQAYILGAYVAIFSTIFNYFIGQGISAYQAERYAGAGVNAVDLAVILALGLPVAWHLATFPDQGLNGIILKFINYAYLPASIFAITLTASRTALFAGLPMIFYLLGTTKRLKSFSRIVMIFALFGSLLALQTYIPQGTLARLGTTADSIAAGDLGGRVKLWHASMEIFSEHPLLGVGSGALDLPTLLGAFAHNTFVSVLSELGLIGFILFASILVIVIYQALKQMKDFSALWITVLATWGIGAFSLTWEFRKPTWLFFSLVIISGSLFSRDSQVLVNQPIIPSAMGSREDSVAGT